MKNIIESIISTQKGWIVRQVLKYIAVGSAALSTWLVARGADPDSAQVIASGLAAAASGAAELFLSKLASKVAAK